MDVAWIPVFVLTLSECVAPAGKTVCQESQFELQFVTEADCQVALEQLITLKEESEKAIVNTDKSSCAPSARQQNVFASLDAITEAHRNTAGWRSPEPGKSAPATVDAAHRERLAKLKTCEETGGTAPCKIGRIIIEGTSESDVEVWKQRN